MDGSVCSSDRNLKKKVYNTVAHSGIWFLTKFFPEYFASEPLQPTDRYIEYPWVIGHLPSPPTKVLDVGCSGSMFPLILQAIGYTVHGIDIREYHPQHKIFFTKGNVCIAPFADDTFDCVTAVSSIEHIGLKGRYGAEEDVTGDCTAIKEIHRILKPEGKLLMTVPHSKQLVITDSHKIYNNARLNAILWKFRNVEMQYAKSPETTESDLALIKAVK